MQTSEIVTLVILSIILFLSFYYYFTSYKDYSDCNSQDHPACMSFSCGTDKTTTDPVCRGDVYNQAYPPFRHTADDQVECFGASLSPIIYRK
jgi:hypothetical protein